MKYKVMYTAGAKKDLRNIFRYISEELLAPENAAGQLHTDMDIPLLKPIHPVIKKRTTNMIYTVQAAKLYIHIIRKQTKKQV